MQRRLHDTGNKHKLSLAEFRELNTFLTSTQAEFRKADESRAGKLGLEELDGSLKRAGPPLRVFGCFFFLLEENTEHTVT